MKALRSIGYLCLKPGIWLVLSACSSSTSGQSSGTVIDAGSDGSVIVGSSCKDINFRIATSLSASIASVGIVQWSLNTQAASAHIDFGRDASNYEYRAPVNQPSLTDNRTMLLGMKPSTTYSFQITAQVGDSTCTSDVQQITTGAKLNGLPTITTETTFASEADQGFTLFCTGAGGTPGPMAPQIPDGGIPDGGIPDGGIAGPPGRPGAQGPGGSLGAAGSGYALIVDADGDIVWWYESGDCARVLMSYDGQFMWMGNINVGGGTGGTLERVTLDGTTVQSYSSVVPERHHDFAILPDESIVLIEYDPNDGVTQGEGCDIVATMNPETQAKQTLFTVNTVAVDATQATSCHANSVNWWPDKQLFTLSVLDWDSILAFDASGQFKWAMGGQLGATYYPGISWTSQHQHHLLSDSLLLFNNRGSDGSSAIEYSLLEGMAQPIFSYSSGFASNTLGDAKRLSNGNTLVTYSNVGLIHEVNAAGQLVQSISTSSIGFTVRRHSLYGPPPPYAR